MKEIKLTIGGKEVQLTDNQLRTLGIETSKNPFDRVAVDDWYYFILVSGEVKPYIYHNDDVDSTLTDNCNYFNDKEFAQQVALHQLLYRKLLKFAYDNGCEDTAEWNEENQHWTICYNHNRYKFEADNCGTFHRNDVYFSSEDGAKAAIKEVVEPFMKEHPDFVW